MTSPKSPEARSEQLDERLSRLLGVAGFLLVAASFAGVAELICVDYLHFSLFHAIGVDQVFYRSGHPPSRFG